MTLVTVPKLRTSSPTLPSLEPGDRLDQETFHARYEAMPPEFHAELIGGVVFMPSPVRVGHGETHAIVVGWVGFYSAYTPGVKTLDNATIVLSEISEPQPDVILRLENGSSKISEDDYLVGPPEFICEIASSSESIDLFGKKDDYQKAGVREYMVVALRSQKVFWFVLENGKYREQQPDADGIFRSHFLAGLWLDPSALLKNDSALVLEVLKQGIALRQKS